MSRRAQLPALVLLFFIISMSFGCTAAPDAGDAPAEEVEKKEYLTGVVYTEKEGVKEFDCSHKIFACREDEIDGEKFLNCLAGDPVGGLQITGGVTNSTLAKEECIL